MKNNDLISVIIPMYNVESYIEGCLRSVIGGDYRNIEIICVDDGSTDGTVDAVKQMQSIDARIRLIEQSNAGVSAARNNGLQASQGVYIAYIDADDWIAKDYLATLYEVAQEKQADIVRCNFISIGRYNPNLRFPSDNEYEVYQIQGNKKGRGLIHLVRPVWCALYRKEICPFFDLGVQIAEDMMYNIRIISSHPDLSAWMCSKRMYAHYYRPASLIGSAGTEEHYLAFNSIVEHMDTLPVQKYAVITAVKQALAFREHIDMTGKTECRPRAKTAMKKAFSLLLRCREIPIYEKAKYIPFMCSARLYRMYRRSRVVRK